MILVEWPVPRPGRRPLDRDDPSVAVTFRAPSRLVDGLYAAARRARISLPELIRRRVLPEAPRPLAPGGKHGRVDEIE
jgi:hypothetical protein